MCNCFLLHCYTVYQTIILFIRYWFSSSKSLPHAQKKSIDFEMFVLFVYAVLLDKVVEMSLKDRISKQVSKYAEIFNQPLSVSS